MGIKQVKLIEGKSVREIEENLNALYFELDTKGGKVIATSTISKDPLILQVVYLTGDKQ